MNKLLKKLLLFMAPITLVLLLLFIVIDRKVKKDANSFKLHRNKKNIVIGDSFIKYAIDDTFLRNTQNMGLDSEGYIYSYFKIKLLNQNDLRTDTVFLGVNYHSFSEYMNDHILHPQVVSRYFHLLDLRTQMNVLSEMKDPFDFLLQNLKEEVENLIFNMHKRKWQGGHISIMSTSPIDMEIIDSKIQESYYRDQNIKGFSELQILYFEKIVNYCKANDIKLIILKTPIHRLYEEKVPLIFKNEYTRITSGRSFQVIKFKGLDINEKDFLQDGHHLSSFGAMKVTKHLRNLLKSKPESKAFLFKK